MTTRTPLVVVNGQTQQMPVGDTVPLTHGGTGATTAGDALTALGAVPSTRTLTMTAPLTITGGGTLSADRTLGLSYDTTLQVVGVALGVSSLVALATHTHTPASIGAEPALGSPGTSGYVLSSTTAGVRSWVPQWAFTGVLASSQGGTGVNNGANTLTVPASGTAALLNVAQTFTQTQTLSAGLNVGNATGATAGQIKVSHSYGAIDSRAVSNPATQVGYLGGARFRFGYWNDTNDLPYADIIDLSTYSDSSGGGVNALYFSKSSQAIVHKYAAAGATSWTARQVALFNTDGSFSAPTATITPGAFGVSTGLTVVNGDITTYRSGGTTGVIYLNSSGTRYLYNDGTDYILYAAQLKINGSLALHAANYSSYALPLSGGTLSGNLTFSNLRNGIVGTYSAANTQQIFAMGAAYVLSDPGSSSSYGSFYGLGWSYEPHYGGTGNNPQSKAGLLHQLLVMNNGATQTAIGTGIWTAGSVTVGGSVSIAGNTALHTGNIGSYGYVTAAGSVAYATNAGTAANVAANLSPATASLIPSGANLNDYYPGFFYQNSNPSAAAGSNYPTAEAGSLLSQYAAGGTQLYTTYSQGSDMYFRSEYGGWGAWRKLLHTGNIGSYGYQTAAGSVAYATNAGYAQYLWSTSHPSSYYVSAAWTGTYWNLTSNHGALVSCGYATSAGSAGSAGTATRANYLNTLYVADMNTILPAGIYQAYAPANAPNTWHWHWLQMPYQEGADGYAAQIAVSLYTDTMMFRSQTSTDWGVWREVIHSGNIGEAWRSDGFQSGWSDYDGGATYNTFGFWKDALGVVHLRGLISRAADNYGQTVIAHLPGGYIPYKRELHVCMSSSGPLRVDVDRGDGSTYCNIVVMESLPPGGWVSLDGFTFRTT